MQQPLVGSGNDEPVKGLRFIRHFAASIFRLRDSGIPGLFSPAVQ
jgi:hypothetical protein